jgi:two-component system chemotaxis response regulator CheY
MKTLIVDDCTTSRLLLRTFLASYGLPHTATGREALEAVRLAWEDGELYDLICLDTMMPEMDGHEILRELRGLEEARGFTAGNRVKVVMTTALTDRTNVLAAAREHCDAYLAKPIRKARLLEGLSRLRLIT